jgi:hypothetical protein
MKLDLLKMFVSLVSAKLSQEQLRELVDKGLDMVEDCVKGTENEYDDVIVLPMCKLIRDSFSIPDNDE